MVGTTKSELLIRSDQVEGDENGNNNAGENDDDEEEDNDFDYIQYIDISTAKCETSIKLINAFMSKCDTHNFVQENFTAREGEREKLRIQHVAVVEKKDDKEESEKSEKINVVNGEKKCMVYSEEKREKDVKKKGKESKKGKSESKYESPTKVKSESKNRKDVDEELGDFVITQTTDIPKSMIAFKKLLFALDASQLDDQSESPFQFKPISSIKTKYEFTTHESYVNHNIPQVLTTMWNKLQIWWRQSIEEENKRVSRVPNRDSATSKTRDKIPFVIIKKIKKDDPCEGIYTLKCMAVRYNKYKSIFSFGQIVVLSFYESDIDGFKQEISVFGIVSSMIDVDIFNESRCDKILLESKCEASELENMFVDQFNIETRPLSESLRLHSSGFAMKSVQGFLTQVRAIYEMAESGNPLAKQILKPIYQFANIGICINMEKRKSIAFKPDQLDAIQKAYQTFLSSDSHFSNVVCVCGPKKSGKTEIMRESLIQLIEFGSKRLDKTSKILIISKNEGEIKSIVDQLKRHHVKVYHVIEKGQRISPTIEEIKNEAAKLTKFRMSNQSDLVESLIDVLNFYNGQMKITSLNPMSCIQEERIRNEVKLNLMSESQVIIGSLEAITSDELLNNIFGPSRDKIKNVFIDDAHWLDEPQIVSLLYYGVQKIVMFGQYLDKTDTKIPVRKNYFNRYMTNFYNKFMLDVANKLNSCKQSYNRATSSVIVYSDAWFKMPHGPRSSQHNVPYRGNSHGGRGERGRGNAHHSRNQFRVQRSPNQSYGYRGNFNQRGRKIFNRTRFSPSGRRSKSRERGRYDERSERNSSHSRSDTNSLFHRGDDGGSSFIKQEPKREPNQYDANIIINPYNPAAQTPSMFYQSPPPNFPPNIQPNIPPQYAHHRPHYMPPNVPHFNPGQYPIPQPQGPFAGPPLGLPHPSHHHQQNPYQWTP